MSISIIMSAHNDEKFIEKSIYSLLNQTLKDFELLIIDDNSKDNTYEIIKKIGVKDTRIIYFRNKLNKGLAFNLNFLIEKTKFNYVARADSDDYYHPNRLEIQKKFLDANSNIDILGTNAFEINDNSKIISKINKSKLNPNIKNSIYIANPIIHSSVVFRKKKLFSKNFFFYNTKYRRVQDYDLWLRNFKNNIYILDDYLTYYRSSNRFNIKLMLSDLYYGNLCRFNNIKNFKTLMISLFIFNIYKIITLIRKLLFN